MNYTDQEIRAYLNESMPENERTAFRLILETDSDLRERTEALRMEDLVIRKLNRDFLKQRLRAASETQHAEELLENLVTRKLNRDYWQTELIRMQEQQRAEQLLYQAVSRKLNRDFLKEKMHRHQVTNVTNVTTGPRIVHRSEQTTGRSWRVGRTLMALAATLTLLVAAYFLFPTSTEPTRPIAGNDPTEINPPGGNTDGPITGIKGSEDVDTRFLSGNWQTTTEANGRRVQLEINIQDARNFVLIIRPLTTEGQPVPGASLQSTGNVMQSVGQLRFDFTEGSFERSPGSNPFVLTPLENWAKNSPIFNGDVLIEKLNAQELILSYDNDARQIRFAR